MKIPDLKPKDPKVFEGLMRELPPWLVAMTPVKPIEVIPGPFTIDMQVEDVALWIPINNLFTTEEATRLADWYTPWDYWNGILIQLGQFHPIDTYPPQPQPLPPESILNEVVLTRDNGSEIKYTDNQFANGDIWINVVAGREDYRRPPVGNLAERNHLLPVQAGANERFKIHAGFEPYNGGITFWQDKRDGYTLEAKQYSHHNSYLFNCVRRENFEVSIHNVDSNDSNNGSHYDIQKITLTAKDPEGDPGDHKNPPAGI